MNDALPVARTHARAHVSARTHGDLTTQCHAGWPVSKVGSNSNVTEEVDGYMDTRSTDIMLARLDRSRRASRLTASVYVRTFIA